VGFAVAPFAKRYIITLANFFGGFVAFNYGVILTPYPIMLVYSLFVPFPLIPSLQAVSRLSVANSSHLADHTSRNEWTSARIVSLVDLPRERSSAGSRSAPWTA
jgi:hypothetical protein